MRVEASCPTSTIPVGLRTRQRAPSAALTGLYDGEHGNTGRMRLPYAVGVAERPPHTCWRTVAFAPAPPGWRVVSLFPDHRTVRPIAGWLTQEEYGYDVVSDAAFLPPGQEITGPARRVIPGIVMDGYGWQVEPIDEGMSFDRET